MAADPLAFKRAKTRRGRRYLEERMPKEHENPKSILYLHGAKCSMRVKSLFKDLHAMTKPHSQIFSRKRDLRPMEDEAPLESMSAKLDASLFAVGTHNKKRPDNITLARMFNFRLLDMVELGVDHCKLLHSFKDVEKSMEGNKPCLVFNGHPWVQDDDFAKLKSMLADFFRGAIVDKINLKGIDRVVSFTATEDKKVLMRQYRILMKKSGSRLPLVELVETGPSADFVLRRTRWASDDLWKEALKQPKTVLPKKKKNIAHDSLGQKLGTVHMQKQDLNKLQLRKLKALKKGRNSTGDEPSPKQPRMDTEDDDQ